MAGSSAKGSTNGAGKKVDPTHPDVQALSNAGISVDRLHEMVNNATKPIAHEAVSDATAATNKLLSQASQQQTAQQQQQQQAGAEGIYIPPLDTQGFQQASELGPMFQQMLAQLVTPPVPANPQIQQPTAANQATANG